MASRDAVIEKRVRALARLQNALPGLRLKRVKGGDAAYQEAAAIEQIADYLERQQQSSRKPAKAEQTAEAAAE